MPINLLVICTTQTVVRSRPITGHAAVVTLCAHNILSDYVIVVTNKGALASPLGCEPTLSLHHAVITCQAFIWLRACHTVIRAWLTCI